MTALRFAQLMSTPAGRFARALVGVVLIATGFFVDHAAGLAIAFVGAIALSAGIFNVCFVAPILRVPFWGANLPSPQSFNRRATVPTTTKFDHGSKAR